MQLIHSGFDLGRVCIFELEDAAQVKPAFAMEGTGSIAKVMLFRFDVQHRTGGGEGFHHGIEGFAAVEDVLDLASISAGIHKYCSTDGTWDA